METCSSMNYWVSSEIPDSCTLIVWNSLQSKEYVVFLETQK